MKTEPMSAARLVFITGASSGIGAAIAREYARRGKPLILTARRQDRLEVLAQEFSPLPCRIIVADLADPEVLALRHYSTVSGVGAVQIAQELNAQLLAEDGFALTGMRVDHNEGQIFIACQQQACQEVPAP